MLPYILAALLLFFALLPAILLFYFWASKYRACPFCGESILKGVRSCSHCHGDIPGEGTPDEKIAKVGEPYGEGARAIAGDEGRLDERARRKARSPR